jgi:predicted AAA+ superfamily ATPase
VGKTTLALAVAEQTGALYLDLEAREDREKLSDPALFLRAYEDRLVILDEIHRVPELFQALRGLIDRGRRHGRRYGRFLMLGSASLDLLRQSGESLAGRIAYVEMGPIEVLEAGKTEAERRALWLRGGFPDSLLARSDEESLKLREDFIRTYLERDVPQFGPRIPAETLERFWTMLAHSQGALLNASRLAAGLSVSMPTVVRYIDLLVDLLLARRLPPFHANTGKRLVKSPKTYVRDSGILITTRSPVIPSSARAGRASSSRTCSRSRPNAPRRASIALRPAQRSTSCSTSPRGSAGPSRLSAD